MGSYPDTDIDPWFQQKTSFIWVPLLTWRSQVTWPLWNNKLHLPWRNNYTLKIDVNVQVWHEGWGGGGIRDKKKKKGGVGIRLNPTLNLVYSQVIYTKRLSERKLCQNKFNLKSWFLLQQTEHKWLLTNNFIPYPCLDNKLRRRLALFYDKFQERKWINLALEFLNSINPMGELCLSWGYQGNSICKKQDIARCSQFCMVRWFIVHSINKTNKKSGRVVYFDQLIHW